MGCNCNEYETFSFGSTASASPVASGIMPITSISHGTHNPFVSTELQEERLKICKECSFHTSMLNKDRCTVGEGSFLKARTSLKDQNCPHPEGSKW